MSFEFLVGHVIPIVLVGVAILLIIQSLLELRRDSKAPDQKPEPEPEGGNQAQPGGRASDETPSSETRSAESARSVHGGDATAGQEASTSGEAGVELAGASGGRDAPPEAGLSTVGEKASGSALPADLSLDLGDLEDDNPWEITLISKVPKEILDKLEGSLSRRESDSDREREVQEFFLVTAVARSDRGLKRKVNEDAYFIDESEPLFLVADGMGGYAGGDVASRLAVEVIAKAFSEHDFSGPVNADWPEEGDQLVRTFHLAHEKIRELKDRRPKYAEMGTTAVAARFSKDKTKVFIANCGDSRCYRVRGGALEQLTTDHTLATLLGVKGRAGRKLTQALGVHESIAVDLTVDEPRAGDLYLVCSDGLTKMVDDASILQIVLGEQELKAMAERLIDEANARGGKDNITVIVIKVEPKPGAIVDAPPVEPAS